MEESMLLVEEFALDSFKPLDCDFDEVIFKDENTESNRESNCLGAK